MKKMQSGWCPVVIFKYILSYDTQHFLSLYSNNLIVFRDKESTILQVSFNYLILIIVQIGYECILCHVFISLNLAQIMNLFWIQSVYCKFLNFLLKDDVYSQFSDQYIICKQKTQFIIFTNLIVEAHQQN